MKAKAILQHVEQTYSEIAREFDATRNHPWPEFEVFFAKLPKNSAAPKSQLDLLDVGCGNGRLADFLTARSCQNLKISYTGIDNSRTMIQLAKNKNPTRRFRLAEATSLPFPARRFDTVWCIAMLHHLPTTTLRLKALKEMRRVLRPSGVLMLTVWNLRQPKYKKFIQQNGDAWIPWGKEKKLRYYYAFREKELRELLKRAGFTTSKKIPSQHNFAFACRTAV